ncbi:MAG: sulfurtransferase [Bacteroidota bacterium]
MFNTIISAAELSAHLTNPHWRIIDCRHDLSDTEAGRRAHAAGHIPGALFAHLDEDLSGPIIPGTTGRHPLPCVTAMEQQFSKWGIGAGTQVVVYDDKRGAIASRLWWMLRYLGHDAVAVLDGGLAAWQAQGGTLSTDVIKPNATDFKAEVQADWVRDADAVMQSQQDTAQTIVDSRGANRYRGEVEPIDPVAGHIPGAISMPFAENWQEDGFLKSADALRERFADLSTAEQTTFYCGSGVTACHNLLAYAHAGLGNARLYPGSWSDWITDLERGVERS